MANVGEVQVLSEPLALQRADELVALDVELRESMGPAYSHIAWEASHFLRPMPSKWALSHVLINSEGNVIGFWIASRRGKDLHTHRVAIHRKNQGSGCGRRLFEAVLFAGRSLGLNRMTLTVGVPNLGALRFYESLGLVRQGAESIQAFLHEHGRKARAEGDVLWEEGRYPYYLYFLTLRQG